MPPKRVPTGTHPPAGKPRASTGNVAAAAGTGTGTGTGTESSASTLEKRSKKRKAEEDANIKKYAEQIKQKEMAKKRQQSMAPTTTAAASSTATATGTPRRTKSMSNTTTGKSSSSSAAAAATTSTTTAKVPPSLQPPQRQAPVKKPPQKSRSSWKPPTTGTNMEVDNEPEEEDDDDEQEEVKDAIPTPPSSKRRRIDYSRHSVSAPVAAVDRVDPDVDRARKWYQENLAPTVQKRPATGNSLSTSSTSTTGTTVYGTADILSTPKPPPQQYSEANIAPAISHAPSSWKVQTEAVTPPRRNTTTSGRTTGTGMPYYRSDKNARTSIVNLPPPSQTLRNRIHSSSKSLLQKAPFGSPLPTIPSTIQQQPQHPMTSAQSPRLALPSADELNVPHHEPTILSPNYHHRSSSSSQYHDHVDDDYVNEANTILHQQQQYRQSSSSSDQEGKVDRHGANEQNPFIARNKDAWIAFIAFAGVLLLSFIVALIMDPDAVLSKSTTSFFSSLNRSSKPLSAAGNQPCFMDHPIRNNVEIEEEIALIGHNHRVCEDATHPCPRGGHCMDGKLKLCYDSYLQVSPDGTSCIFTDEAQRDFNTIFDLLTKYTVQHFCMGPKRAKNPFYIRDSSSSNESHEDGSARKDAADVIRRTPLYDYRSITDVLLLQYSPKLMIHATVANKNENTESIISMAKIIVERNEHDGSMLIGLHPSQHVPLPFDCFLTKITFSLLKTLMVWIGTVSVWILSRIVLCYIEYPITLIGLSIVVGVTSMIIQKRGRVRRAQIQFTNEVVSFRERVYDELMKDKNTSIPALMICDRIAWNLYPTSSQKRRRIREVILPYVSRDLETDSRIIVSWRAASSGFGRTTTKPELHWQWKDTQPHMSTTTMEQTQH